MNVSDDSNTALSNAAYSKSNFDLWDQNFVNGEYIIAFELSPQLHYKIRRMLPQVGWRLTFKNIGWNIVFFVLLGCNLYWESGIKLWQSLAPSPHWEFIMKMKRGRRRCQCSMTDCHNLIPHFKAMKKIEDVTCIKFEERSKNHHQEMVY